MRTLLLLTVAFTAVAADPKLIAGLKSAQDAYEESLDKARKSYRTAVRKSVDEYVDKLKAIQAERTRAGDLDGAIRVRDAIAAVEADSPVEPAVSKETTARRKLAAGIVATQWIPNAELKGWGDRFAFKADGFAYAPPSAERPTWRWEAIGPDTVVTVSNTGAADVWVFDADLKRARVSYLGNAELKGKSGATAARGK